MTNSTPFTQFILDAYLDVGLLKYLVFITVMCLYIVIIVSNVLLIVVICVNRSLHEPMYFFLCSLFVNELLGSTAVFPLLLTEILRDIHTIPVSFCFLQIFSIYSYANIELCILAAMSYDRYLSICHPLQYHTNMTSTKVAVLIALTWGFPVVEVGVMVSLSAPLHLCGNVIPKVYCDNYYIVKLACSDITVNNFYGIVYTVIIICSVLSVIIYSYSKILKVCFSGSKQTRHKAVSTCTPHIVSLLNFCFGCCFEIFQSRFNMTYLPTVLRVFLSLYFLTCQPLFSPLIYGLNLTKIRNICKSIFCVNRMFYNLSVSAELGSNRHRWLISASVLCCSVTP
ncbi:olfactory receptor 11A1-like [Sphaeramia orbicularis]|uniref:Olfactory receptor n=1 Tax=Sphaeramia orbicularis TaxID=375764 RepID=A0A672Z7F2_9TELE|nr:olfactory receptor 11A1-like [Sphaeramia orbicularis]